MDLNKYAHVGESLNYFLTSPCMISVRNTHS
jgi:hypothetical protein